MRNDFYVYVYLDTRKEGEFIYGNLKFTHEPFYIGKGSGKRMFFHLYESANTKSKIRFNKIRSIRKSGLEPIVYKLYENLTEVDSLRIETETIKIIGRKDLNKGPLINLTDGGEGESGYIFTDEHRNNLSNSLKNSKVFQEASRSEENKRKTSESLKAFYKTHIHNSVGKEKTKEEIAKIKETMSVVYKIQTPNDDVIEIKGTEQVKIYFKELNEKLGLKSRFQISPIAIMYGNGSKGYKLIEKLNDYRDMKWSDDKKKKWSDNNTKGKNKNSCKYLIEFPNGELKEFLGREQLKNYFTEINENYGGIYRISYESIINKGENKGYKLISKEKIYKKHM